jgi:integrase
MQKTGEPIEIPMAPFLEETLRAEIKAVGPASPYIFMSTRRGRNGQLTKFSTVRNSFRRALERSGLTSRGYCFHDIRRTFASKLYADGVPLVVVSRLLGHRSVTTTERYLGVRLEEKRLAVAALESEWGPGLNRALEMHGIRPRNFESEQELYLLTNASENRGDSKISSPSP